MPTVEGLGDITKAMGHPSKVAFQRQYDINWYPAASLIHPTLSNPDEIHKRGYLSDLQEGPPIWALAFDARGEIELDTNCRTFLVDLSMCYLRERVLDGAPESKTNSLKHIFKASQNFHSYKECIEEKKEYRIQHSHNLLSIYTNQLHQHLLLLCTQKDRPDMDTVAEVGK